METRLTKYSMDGVRQGHDIYRFTLRCVAAAGLNKEDEYTCIGFSIQLNNATEVSIPSLRNWKYLFTLAPDKQNDKEHLFGINHSKFEQLIDENGRALPPDNAYHVYNAFIDFHTMSVFSERTDTGKGAQDLRFIGDTVTHAASYSKPPVNLGNQVSKGSYFQNGRITLEFKGISQVNNSPCGLLGYDSGESDFFMIVKATPSMEVTTKGTSHYWGDIYKSFTSGWIQRAVLHELVISETTVPVLTNKVTSIIERTIEIENVNKSKLNVQ
ncbi:MAG TPA: hypothetical protein VGD22_18305 [Sphingobacteriaceae bacterium]